MEIRGFREKVGASVHPSLNSFIDYLIAELLTRTPIDRPYMVYGRNHERELWARFREELHEESISNWLCNGRDIITLDLENAQTLNTFLKDSGYNP